MRMTEEFAIAVERLENTAVLTPAENMGELNSEAISQAFGQLREELKDAVFTRVVLDFYRTDYFSSTVLNEIIRLWQDVRSRQGQMVLCGLSRMEQEILKVMRLDGLWSICGSRDEAISMVCEMGKSGVRCGLGSENNERLRPDTNGDGTWTM